MSVPVLSLTDADKTAGEIEKASSGILSSLYRYMLLLSNPE
jgi:hypothetical protein